MHPKALRNSHPIILITIRKVSKGACNINRMSIKEAIERLCCLLSPHRGEVSPSYSATVAVQRTPPVRLIVTTFAGAIAILDKVRER